MHDYAMSVHECSVGANECAVFLWIFMSGSEDAVFWWIFSVCARICKVFAWILVSWYDNVLSDCEEQPGQVVWYTV